MDSYTNATNLLLLSREIYLILLASPLRSSNHKRRFLIGLLPDAVPSSSISIIMLRL